MQVTTCLHQMFVRSTASDQFAQMDLATETPKHRDSLLELHSLLRHRVLFTKRKPRCFGVPVSKPRRHCALC